MNRTSVRSSKIKAQATKSTTTQKLPDFFISRNKADRQWAEWIAWQLEHAGYATVLQDWDFGVGENFVLAMQRATTTAKRTIAVLSPDFLKSAYTAPEWAAAWAKDPTGVKRKLVPVMVRACEPTGLLAQVVYVDLVGLSEPAAKERLLRSVQQGRAKPLTAPPFPGKAEGKKPVFPGRSRANHSVKSTPSPKPAGHLWDLDAATARMNELHWGTDPQHWNRMGSEPWFSAVLIPERQNSPYLSELQLGNADLPDRILQLALHGKSAILRSTQPTTPSERADHLRFDQQNQSGRGNSAYLGTYMDGSLVFGTTLERAASLSSSRSIAESYIIDELAVRRALAAFVTFADQFYKQRRRDPGSLFLGMSLSGINHKWFGRLPPHDLKTFRLGSHQLSDPLRIPAGPLKISPAQRARPASSAGIAIAHIVRVFRLAGAYYSP